MERFHPDLDSASAAWSSGLHELDLLAQAWPTSGALSPKRLLPQQSDDAWAVIGQAGSSSGITPTILPGSTPFDAGSLSNGQHQASLPSKTPAAEEKPTPSLSTPSLQASSLTSKKSSLSFCTPPPEQAPNGSLPIWLRRLQSNSAQAQAQINDNRALANYVSPLTVENIVETSRSRERDDAQLNGAVHISDSNLRDLFNSNAERYITTGATNVAESSHDPHSWAQQAARQDGPSLGLLEGNMNDAVAHWAQQQQQQQQGPSPNSPQQHPQHLPDGFPDMSSPSTDWHAAQAPVPNLLQAQQYTNLCLAASIVAFGTENASAMPLPPPMQDHIEFGSNEHWPASQSQSSQGKAKVRRTRGMSHPQPRQYRTASHVSPRTDWRRTSADEIGPDTNASRAPRYNGSTRKTKGTISKVTVPKSASTGLSDDTSDVTSSSEGTRICHVCPHPRCNKQFSTSGHARRHSRIHDDLQPFECPHDGCHATFTRRDNCTQHQRARHGSQLPAHRLTE